MDPLLQRAAELASDYISSFDEHKVGPEVDHDELRARLTKELTDDGVEPMKVLEELNADAAEGLLHSAGGRFFGWVIGGGVPVAVAADFLTSAWDQNAAAYACSPSAGITEDVVGAWLKDVLGLPEHASYAFVTGCQMAHVTGMAAARYKLLADRGWNVQEQGVAGSPPIRVIVGEHHETLLRALRLVGIGTNAVTRVHLMPDGTIDSQALEAELKRDPDAPTIVSLAAGDLNRGAFDPFDAVCELAHAHGAWVHVDGAFGMWAGATRRYRHLVKGIERADSWATDAHKWLNVPYSSGIAFCAHPEAHRASMTITAAYRVEVEGGRDQYEWGPEWSRRARTFPLYAALRALGRNGIRELVERCCDLAKELVTRLGRLDGVEVLAAPIINQGLVRFLDPAGDHDTFTDRVILAINATGEAWFGPTTWEGKRVMRISVSNFRTSKNDVDRVVAAVEKVLKEGVAASV